MQKACNEWWDKQWGHQKTILPIYQPCRYHLGDSSLYYTLYHACKSTLTLFWVQADGTVPPPHMIVVPLARYDQAQKKFENPGTCSKDKLLPKGHQFCRAEEYHLGNGYFYFYLLKSYPIFRVCWRWRAILHTHSYWHYISRGLLSSIFAFVHTINSY